MNMLALGLLALPVISSSSDTAIGATVVGSQAAVRCAAVTGSELILSQSRRYLVFGELHGTSETPELFGDLVCAQVRKGPVVVALEFDEKSTSSLQRFIASPGAVARIKANVDCPRLSVEAR